MQDELTGFREQLLSSQKTSPALRDEYRKELDSLINPRLTPRTRLLAWGSIAVAAFVAATLVRSLLIYHDRPGVKVIMPAYLAVAIGTIAWAGRVLWQGRFSRRASFTVGEGLGSVVVGVYLLVTMFQGMKSPADPASLFSAIMSLMILVVGFAVSTGNRITLAKMETREHLLRLESRVADLVDKMTSGTIDRKS